MGAIVTLVECPLRRDQDSRTELYYTQLPTYLSSVSSERNRMLNRYSRGLLEHDLQLKHPGSKVTSKLVRLPVDPSRRVEHPLPSAVETWGSLALALKHINMVFEAEPRLGLW